MSYLQEAAEACERLLKKHERSTERLEAIRVTPATLAAVRRQGLEIGHRPAAQRRTYPVHLKIANDGRFKADFMAKSRVAARAWLDQPKPRKISQAAIGVLHGVSQAGVSIAVDRERKARRLAHAAGNPSALLATQRAAA